MSNIGQPKKDEVPCRSCLSFSEYVKQSKKRYFSDISKNESLNGTTSETSNTPTTTTGKASLSTNAPRDDCPADKSVLGRSTWIFLHTMAARYPENPSTTDQTEMKNFFKLFAKFYPCEYCSQDFQQEIKKQPPQVSSNEELSQWLCRLHNVVNVKLGKAEFDCNLVNQRWRDGWLDGSCDF